MSCRRYALGFVVVGLVLGSIGCGGASSDPVTAALLKSGHAGAARVLFTLSFSSLRLTGGVPQTVQGQGVMHGAADELTFDFSQGFPPVVARQLGVGQGSIREVKVRRGGDELLYLRVPGVPGGRHWIELDLAKAYRSAGLHLSGLAARPETQDPSQLLALLSGRVGAGHKLGATSTFNGTATDYRVMIDLAKALRAHDANGGPPLFLASASGRKTLAEDVDVGKDGLIEELSATYPLEIRGFGVRLTMKLGFIRYGVRAHVSPPSSRDTLDLTPLLAKASRA